MGYTVLHGTANDNDSRMFFLPRATVVCLLSPPMASCGVGMVVIFLGGWKALQRPKVLPVPSARWRNGSSMMMVSLRLLPLTGSQAAC